VELGEIEHRILSDRRVEKAAVILPKSGLCKERLVAIISTEGPPPEFYPTAAADVRIASKDSSSNLLIASVRENLWSHLPPYMVPETWIIVDDVPKTSSGKINRPLLTQFVEAINATEYRRILDLAISDSTEDDANLPATPMERQLQRILCRVLNRPAEQIVMNRTFLAIGGDSISAMQAMALCRAEGISLDVQQLLRAKSIRQLATGIKSSALPSGMSKGTPASPRFGADSFPLLKVAPDQMKRFISDVLPKLAGTTPYSIEDIYPCSPMQLDMVLSEKKGLGYYNAQFICEVSGNPSVALLQSAWQKIVNRHPILRTVFIKGLSSQKAYDQLVLRQMTIKVDTILCDDEDALSKLRDLPRVDSGSLQPSHKFTICLTSTSRILVSIQINHTIMDGLTLFSIIQDTARASEGKLSEAKAHSYRSLISHIQGQPTELSLKYWRSYLSSSKPCNFPVTCPKAKFPGQHQSISLIISNIAELQAFADDAKVTLANLICTAWALLLHGYTGSDNIIFGYVVSGRDVPIEAVQSIAGPFLNMLPCRSKLSASTSINALCKAVHHDFLNGMDHQHVSPMMLKDALGSKMFDTLVNFRKHDTFSERAGQKENAGQRVAFELLWSKDPMDVSNHLLFPIVYGWIYFAGLITHSSTLFSQLMTVQRERRCHSVTGMAP
jgi:aryl carrier-like protein